MPVSTPNDQYSSAIYKWQLVRDCCKGSDAVKNAQNRTQHAETRIDTATGTLYLPPPNPTDESAENRARYRSYKTRANFVNFTGHTKDAFAGMVCRKDPIIQVPVSLEPMIYNADGMGNSLYTVIKRSLDEVLQVAREGLLIDYPYVNEKKNARQTNGITPTIKPYCAESIINWKTKTIDGQEVLYLVVLRESIAIAEDDFTDTAEEQYRVLILNDDGDYAQRMYNKDGQLLVINDDGDLEIVPKQVSGKPFKFIPFIFLGALNNDPDIDKPPLYDVAEVNIAHYRNSADYEESCFMVGQPTPVLSGLTQNWVDDVLGGAVMLGSRAFITLPVGGSAMLLQANANQMPLEGMRLKEKQLIQIGAKIITEAGGVETAEAARIRFSGQNSKLATIVDNIEQAYKMMLEWSLLFIGGTESDIEIKLNKEFYEKGADPQMITAQLMMLDRQIISTSDIRDYLRRSGNIDSDRSDEDIDDDLGEVNPLL
tara:strand:- start:10591 stop:12042 length:1452 start_codon:yes stop_codon:yes gene_type:complete